MTSSATGIVLGITTLLLLTAAWWLFRIGTRSQGRHLALAVAVTAAVIVVASMIGWPTAPQVGLWGTLSATLLTGGWALGTAIGRERTAAARAAWLEATRRADTERLRLVDEVHDVVSHSVATITMTAGVGAHVSPDDPAVLRAKLLAIEELGRAALADLRVALHATHEGTAGADDRSLVEVVAELDEAARVAGVRLRVDPRTFAAVPPEHSVVVKRVLREGLTNVIRHAQGSDCEVSMDVGRTDLTLSIRNSTGRQPGSAGAGLGLDGLRRLLAERGGSLSSQPFSDGGFLLQARLPR